VVPLGRHVIHPTYQ